MTPSKSVDSETKETRKRIIVCMSGVSLQNKDCRGSGICDHGRVGQNVKIAELVALANMVDDVQDAKIVEEVAFAIMWKSTN